MYGKCIDNVSIPTAVKYRDIDTKLFRIETVSMNYEPLADIDRTYNSTMIMNIDSRYYS